MKKQICSLVLVLVLALSLTACGGKAISAVKAQKIAVKDAGAKVSEAEGIHTHIGTAADGTPYYDIHFSVDGTPYNYQISASGEVLSVSNTAAH